MGAIASQITSLTVIYSTVYSDAGQRKHQSSTSVTFVRGIHRWPINYPHKGPVTRKIFPFDDVIIFNENSGCAQRYMETYETFVLCILFSNQNADKSGFMVSNEFYDISLIHALNENVLFVLPFCCTHSEKCDFCIILRPSPWWRHQMEIFSALLALCGRGNTFFIIAVLFIVI